MNQFWQEEWSDIQLELCQKRVEGYQNPLVEVQVSKRHLIKYSGGVVRIYLYLYAYFKPYVNQKKKRIQTCAHSSHLWSNHFKGHKIASSLHTVTIISIMLQTVA